MSSQIRHRFLEHMEVIGLTKQTYRSYISGVKGLANYYKLYWTREMRQYRNSDLDDVLSSWENSQTLAHPFLPDAFQKQEKKNIRELCLPNADTWVA